MKAHGLASRLLAVPAALRTAPGQWLAATPFRVADWDARNAPSAPRARAMAATSSAQAAAPPMPPFHLAFPVNDLAASSDFYGRCAACAVATASLRWRVHTLQNTTQWNYMTKPANMLAKRRHRVRCACAQGAGLWRGAVGRPVAGLQPLWPPGVSTSVSSLQLQTKVGCSRFCTGPTKEDSRNLHMQCHAVGELCTCGGH